MRRLANSLILVFLLLLPTISFAALSANTVWEYRTVAGSSNNNGGGFVWINLVSSTYKWTASGSGTNEYYCDLLAGGDPSLSKSNVTTDGTFKLDTEGTMGSLNAGEWDYGDNDSLGYSTVYVRLDDGADPDSKNPFFVSLGKGGGTDYSQQAAPQLALTDGASAGLGAIITSVTGGFTAAMVGNIVNVVSGTNFTAGRYEIISVDSGNQITVDRNCTTAAGSNGVINVGGSLALPTDAIWEAMVAGNRVFIKNDGSYTLTGDISISRAGTATNLIYLEGYNSTRGDKPTGINKATINCGAYLFTVGNYWNIENIYFSTTVASGVRLNLYNRVYNCKVINSSSTTTRVGFQNWNGAAYILKSEAISTNGVAIDSAGTNDYYIKFNYIHDSSTGIGIVGADLVTAEANVIAECSFGFTATSNAGTNYITGNTFYKSDNATGSYGISTSLTLNPSWRIINNIITGWATGIDWGDTDYTIYIDYNNFYSNTLDIEKDVLTRGLQGADHNIYTDPLLTNPNGTLIEDGEDAWNEYAGTGVTATADGTTYKVGTYSARATCLASTGVEVVMTEALSSTDMSGYNGIAGWFRSTVALNAGDWQVLLDDTANCSSPVVTLALPAMSANTWYWIYLNNTSFANATAIISIGLKQAVDKGAMSFYVDNVRGRDCDFTVQSGSSVLDAGMQVGTTEGLIGDYKWNIGADQDDNTAAGGGSSSLWINN